MIRRLLALGACAAALASVFCGPAEAQVRVLTDQDAAVYAAAFSAASQGDFVTADRESAVASDKSLMGYLQFQKLVWRGARASYGELKEWLAKFADLPGADRILQMARKMHPEGDPDLRTPSGPSADLQADFLPASSGKGLEARQAYYLGDVRKAYSLATASGEKWIAGLAAFRLQDFDAALQNFRAVAVDPASNDWLRSGAAYWAARAAIAAGTPEMAPDFLTIATRTPWTFYGILAERQLGLEAGADPDAYVLAQAGLAPAPPSASSAVLIKADYASISEPDLAALIERDARARRAVALAQIGRVTEANAELKAGLLDAQNETERDLWTTLALQLNSDSLAQARAARGAFDPNDYPTPDIQPDGGFAIDKALVFAVVRQESRFNPYAVSGKGAMGLMQVTPATAVTATGDSSISPLELFDAATNLKIGQANLIRLINGPADGDLLKALAAYDSGPGGLQKALSRVGDGDPLLLMESLPYGETRAYVERVMANYWIYRRMLDEPIHSVDALASGEPRIAPDRNR